MILLKVFILDFLYRLPFIGRLGLVKNINQPFVYHTSLLKQNKLKPLINNTSKKELPDTKVICICDNIIPHEKHFYDIRLIKKIFKHIDAYVVMSSKVEEQLKSIIDDPIYKKLFHPVVSISEKYSKEESRVELGITKKRVVIFFGLIREYKGLDILIQSNKYLREQLNDYLSTKGKSEYYNYLKKWMR